MTKKDLALYGIVVVVVQCLIGWGIFVTMPQMVAYAAPKESITKIEVQLNRIEEKVDRIIMSERIK